MAPKKNPSKPAVVLKIPKERVLKPKFKKEKPKLKTPSIVKVKISLPGKTLSPATPANTTNLSATETLPALNGATTKKMLMLDRINEVARAQLVKDSPVRDESVPEKKVVKKKVGRPKKVIEDGASAKAESGMDTSMTTEGVLVTSGSVPENSAVKKKKPRPKKVTKEEDKTANDVKGIPKKKAKTPQVKPESAKIYKKPKGHMKKNRKNFLKMAITKSIEKPRARKKKKKIKREPESPAPSAPPAPPAPALNGHDELLQVKLEREKASLKRHRLSSGSEPARKHERREPDATTERLASERGAPEPPHEERRTVIRERITFQDDSEPESDAARDSSVPRSLVSPSPPSPHSSRPSPQPSTQPSTRASSVASSGGARLARYVSAHAHLTPVPPDPPDALSAHDDVWVVRAPRGLPAAALAGAALTPGARRRLVAGGRTYETAPTPVERAALLRRGAEWRVRGLALRGALVVRERVPRVRAAPAAPDAAPADPDAVPLPATRRRHPLFGADFERAVPRPPRPAPRAASPPAATRPLVDSDVTDEREHKKKKKKRKRERDSDAEVAPAPAPAPEPRRRKRKRSERAEGRWDSERDIEQNLFDF